MPYSMEQLRKGYIRAHISEPVTIEVQMGVFRVTVRFRQ